MSKEEINTRITSLGKDSIPSPLTHAASASRSKFISDDEGILINIHSEELAYYLYKGKKPPYFELAGGREKIYFDPSKLRCARVTCGGLCPGLNDIIRSIVLELYHLYGVRSIYGIRFGLEGFIAQYGHAVMDLNPTSVAGIMGMGSHFRFLPRSPGHRRNRRLSGAHDRQRAVSPQRRCRKKNRQAAKANNRAPNTMDADNLLGKTDIQTAPCRRCRNQFMAAMQTRIIEPPL